ncbi:MAG: ATP-binding protein [Bacteroidota bacterium]
MYPKDFKIDRILLAVGIVLYAGWGFVYKLTLPSAIDPIQIRFIGIILLLLILILSFVNQFVRNNFTYILYSAIFLVTLHQCYLVLLNKFSSEYLIIFIVLIVTLNAYFKNSLHLLYYAIFSISAITCSYLLLNGNSIVSFAFFISSVITINALVVPIFISRLRIREKLEEKLTELKRSELSLKLKSDELVRSNNELQQFAYVASHDLQEPLRMVTSYVQLLEDRYTDKLDQDAKEFISFAVDGTRRMRNLIQSLLDYSRVNNTKPFEQINVNVLLDDILIKMKEQIEENNAVLKIDKLPVINGDPIQIAQLFKHLISNALKFRHSTKNPEIVISVKNVDGANLFSIKDNGIGISKEYWEKIFVIFQRLHTKEKYPGTGIGLAICRKIVEQHGGKIWVESALDNGATFYFTIK